MLQAGDRAPAVTVQNQDGIEVSLRDFAGSWVVLYFYPKDNTPGCTIETCEFNEMMNKFTQNKATIFGISPDSCQSHKKFINKFDVGFSLLVDENKEMLNAYGVWGMKKNFGKEYEGVIRSTFIIDPDGNIAKAYPKVKAKGHAQEVFDDLVKLQENK